jgi:membrane-bound ClpP family serine protease
MKNNVGIGIVALMILGMGLIMTYAKTPSEAIIGLLGAVVGAIGGVLSQKGGQNG